LGKYQRAGREIEMERKERGMRRRRRRRRRTANPGG
jgi:hypothetical protein